METGQKDAVQVSSLVQLGKCEKYYQLSQLNLSDAGSKRRKLFMGAMRRLLELLPLNAFIDAESVMPRIKEYLGESYSSDSFTCVMECDAAKETDYQKLNAFVSYLDQNRLRIVHKNMELELHQPVDVGRYHFPGIRCRIDMVLADSAGKKEAVILEPDRPRYNNRARVAANRPVNSPELVAAVYALKEGGIPCDRVSIYSLTAREGDSTVFSIRDNTASVQYTDFQHEETGCCTKNLQDLLSCPEKKGCDECRYMHLCSINTDIVSSNDRKRNGSIGHTALTKQQETIAQFKDGVMRVIAIPGSGKTFSLVQRLMNLVKSGVPPEKILFVTFANKAAGEIQERVSELIHSEKKPEITTFNALGMQILLENGHEASLATGIKVTELILELLSDERIGKLQGFSYENVLGKYGIVGRLRIMFEEITRDGKDLFLAKQHRKGADLDYAGIFRFYDVYMEERRVRNLISYDEQVSKAVGLLKTDPEVLKRYGERWDYIMADEYQDVSQDDASLLYLLADAGKRNLMCVGDMDQAIYAFRAKDCDRQLFNLSVRYLNCKTVFMNDNFRCTEEILRAGNALISNNPDRLEYEMNAHRPDGTRPVYMGRYRMEALPRIIRRLNDKGYRMGDIGILGRYNRTLFHALEILDAAGMPSQSPKTYLRDNMFFLMLYDLLNIHFNGFSDDRTDTSFYRLYLAYGAENLLYKKEGMRYKNIYDNLVQDGSISPVNFDSIADCLPYQCENTGQSPHMAVMVRIFNVLYELRYGACNMVDKTVERIARIMFDRKKPAAIEDIRKVIRENGIKNLSDLYTHMSRMLVYFDDKKTEWGIHPDKLNLLTAHESKGLEFPAVIILNCEEFEKDDSERKLFYVAMTRAQKELVMVETNLKTFGMKEEITDCITEEKI